MKCPYCPEEISDIDEFSMHVLSAHPEKTTLEEYKEMRRSRKWDTAAVLTGTMFNGVASPKKEDILDAFKFFLYQLIEND